MNDLVSWVIGRGGLLGSSTESALKAKGRTWHPHEQFNWDNPRSIRVELARACQAFAAEVGRSPWQIAWCAGAGVVGSSGPRLEQETDAFDGLLAAAAETLCGPAAGPGSLFLASSAGGIYSGVGSPPYDEGSPVAPLAPYGWNKLSQEALATRWSQQTRTPLLIGRLSNLYGPAQNIAKGQGLITQVCLRVLTRQPLILYVPLDTMRDYLFADDAGRLIADALARLRLESIASINTPTVVKIFASKQPTTVATVLAQVRWVTKRPASVIFGSSPNSQRQARDLRLNSVVWPELADRPMTTLSEGIRRVVTAILHRTNHGRIGDPHLTLPVSDRA